MALAPEQTLGTIRKEVLIRSGMSADGTHPTGDVALIDSFIRSAQKSLFERAKWTRTRLRGTITLVEGETIYEIPDGVHPGSIEEMVVVDENDNEMPLAYGIRSVDRNDAGTSEGAPVLWDMYDQAIHVLPAPSEQWVELRFHYQSAVPPFVNAGEFAVVDSEALIQAAVIKVKSHYEMPGLRDDQIEHERYVDAMRANQSQGTGFTVGGPKSYKTTQPVVRRIGRPSVADPNWKPW